MNRNVKSISVEPIAVLMWNIGDLNIDGQVVLGPMSGYTSAAYRDFMKPFGVAVSMTEMISDMGLVHGVDRTRDYVVFDRNFPTGLQLFGNDPDFLAKAAEKAMEINPNIDFIDINMGCPAAKVTRNGSGSALMGDPQKCGDIVKTMKKATGIPVTAKIRLGIDLDSINFRDVIEHLTAADVDAITVHARTKMERYAGKPHYDMIENLRSEMSVPLIISGNIYSLDDAIDAMKVTGADAVMVARGGVGNPHLVTTIDHYLREGTILDNPTIAQQVDWCISLADAIFDEKGEELGAKVLRSIAPKFVAGCRRSREYRYKLATGIVDRESLVSLMNEICSEMGGETRYSFSGIV